MPCNFKVLGGCLLNSEEAAYGARKYGFEIDEEDPCYISCGQATNRFINEVHGRQLWTYRLMPITLKQPDSETITKLIPPTIWTKEPCDPSSGLLKTKPRHRWSKRLLAKWKCQVSCLRTL